MENHCRKLLNHIKSVLNSNFARPYIIKRDKFVAVSEDCVINISSTIGIG